MYAACRHQYISYQQRQEALKWRLLTHEENVANVIVASSHGDVRAVRLDIRRSCAAPERNENARPDNRAG